MPLRYDYSGVLEVDPETLTAWEPRIQQIEDSAVNTAKTLRPNIAEDNVNLELYAQELVFFTLMGSQLPTSLATYHQNELQKYKDNIKYGGAAHGFN